MNRKYAFIAGVIFVIEVLIALFFKDSFIRPLLGDLLVVMLLFSFVRIFYNGSGLKLALSVLLFSFIIEFSQYFRLVELLGLEHYKLATVVLGSTFDFLDLIAYIIGVSISYYLDQRFLS